MSDIERDIKTAVEKAIESGEWSQNSIATKLKIEQRTLNRWMRGERSISLANAVKLAEWLGMRLTKPKIPKRSD